MSSHTAQGEANLRYWLANEDWYPSAFTRDFFASTPLDEANDALVELAQDADLEKLTPWSLFTIAFAMAGFTMSFGPAGPSINDRKAGIRAALYLAERSDERGLPALARIWSKPGLLQSRYQAEIEAALIQLLQSAPPERTAPYQDELTDLARRIWQARPLRRDLSDVDTTVLLALLPHVNPQAAGALVTGGADASGSNRRQVQAALNLSPGVPTLQTPH